MSDNAEQSNQVEQITKVPSVAPNSVKDPKKVAAGKKLAEMNKIMREEHARYKASEEARRIHETPKTPETETETNDLHSHSQSSLSDGLLSQLSLTNVISLVGIGLTVYTIFFKKSGVNEEKHVSWRGPIETTFESLEVKPQPEPQPKTVPKSKIKPRPKFGM